MLDDEAENRNNSSEADRTERRQSERRRHLRFPFTASVEVIESNSRAKITGRASDLGLGGCYVDTINPLPVGTNVEIRLTKDNVTFEADAKVVFSQVGMGMGVAFTAAVPQQGRIFQRWLNELTGKSVPEPASTENNTESVIETNSAKDQKFVLGELLIALMRNGVLSEAEGKAMLQRLYRQGREGC